MPDGPEPKAPGLSPTEMAERAGVSPPTWRKFLRDPRSVTPRTAAKCRRALEQLEAQSRQEAVQETVAHQVAKVAEIWADGLLTPRQAYAVMVTLAEWATPDLKDWLEGVSRRPLHKVGPFPYFDKRVMMLVADNTAFAAMALERCLTVHGEIERGVLPFERDGCYFDEVLMGAALQKAEEQVQALPELFQDLPERPPHDERAPEGMDGDGEDLPLADEWEMVTDAFDNTARWDDWLIPVQHGHPLLPFVLEVRHPFRWFDVDGPGPTLRQTVRKHLGMTDKQFTKALGRLGAGGT